MSIPTRSTSHALSARPVSLIWSTPLVVSWPCHAASRLASSRVGLGGWGAAEAVIDAHALSSGSRWAHCSRVSIGSGLMDVRSPCLVRSWTKASLACGLAPGGGAVRNGTAAPLSSEDDPASDVRALEAVHVAAIAAAATRRAREALMPADRRALTTRAMRDLSTRHQRVGRALRRRLFRRRVPCGRGVRESDRDGIAG